MSKNWRTVNERENICKRQCQLFDGWFFASSVVAISASRSHLKEKERHDRIFPENAVHLSFLLGFICTYTRVYVFFCYFCRQSYCIATNTHWCIFASMYLDGSRCIAQPLSKCNSSSLALKWNQWAIVFSGDSVSYFFLLSLFFCLFFVIFFSHCQKMQPFEVLSKSTHIHIQMQPFVMPYEATYYKHLLHKYQTEQIIHRVRSLSPPLLSVASLPHRTPPKTLCSCIFDYTVVSITL